MKSPVTLNTPYSPDFSESGGLHVYTISSRKADSVTGCVSGNAVYDADLDTIFIDSEVIKPTDWQRLLKEPDGDGGLDIPLDLDSFPSLRVYLRFVILHELGHRALHRHVANNFDLFMPNSQDQRRREVEADQFAIVKMDHAYRISKSFGIQAVEEYTGQLIHYPVTETTPLPDRVQASLVEMAMIMTEGGLALPTTTSPLRANVSHPAYLDRAQSLVEQSLARTDTDADLKIFTEYTDLWLKRAQTARRSGIVELTADDVVIDVLFDDVGLIVISSGTLRRIPYTKRVFRSLSGPGRGLDRHNGIGWPA
jgi:hypothetical protein